MTVTSSFVTHSVFSGRGARKFCICVSCLQSPYILAVCHVGSVVSHVFTDDCNNHVLQCERDAFPWYYWPKRKHCVRFVCSVPPPRVTRCHHPLPTSTITYHHPHLYSPSLPTPNVVPALLAHLTEHFSRTAGDKSADDAKWENTLRGEFRDKVLEAFWNHGDEWRGKRKLQFKAHWKFSMCRYQWYSYSLRDRLESSNQKIVSLLNPLIIYTCFFFPALVIYFIVISACHQHRLPGK